MSNVEQPIHSTTTLVKAFVIACVGASIIFVTIVLPAEYNIDPTGVGERLGLTVFATAGEAETVLSQTSTDGQSDSSSSGEREDVVTINVPAKKGLEYKFQVQQHEKFAYEWDSAGVDLYFDLHAEPDGGRMGYFESFTEATANQMKGSVFAPFTGSHGWYFQNRTEEDAVVTLKTKGNYEIIGLK